MGYRSKLVTLNENCNHLQREIDELYRKIRREEEDLKHEMQEAKNFSENNYIVVNTGNTRIENFNRAFDDEFSDQWYCGAEDVSFAESIEEAFQDAKSMFRGHNVPFVITNLYGTPVAYGRCYSEEGKEPVCIEAGDNSAKIIVELNIFKTSKL